MAVFVYDNSWSNRNNLRRDDLAALRLLAENYLSPDQADLAAAQAV